MKTKIEYLKNSKLIWYGISTAILLGLIYLADINQFIDAIKSIKSSYMVLAFISGLSVFLVWGYIWHSFFEQLGIESHLGKSYRLFMAGNFMNSITPLGQLGGEPLMAAVISKNTESSYEESLSSVISADIVNSIPFLTYLVVAVVYLILFGTSNTVIWNAAYLMIGLILTMTTIIYLTWFNGDLVEKGIFRLLNYLARKTNRGEKYIEVLKKKISELRKTFDKIGDNPNHLIKITAVSHLAPLTQFICMYFLISGMGIDPGVTGVFLTVVLGGLAMWSPTPGGSGAIEAAMTTLLKIFYPSIGLGTAVAVAVLFRLTTYWPGILIGYVSLISLRKRE